jgi:hypothetical protein
MDNAKKLPQVPKSRKPKRPRLMVWESDFGVTGVRIGQPTFGGKYIAITSSGSKARITGRPRLVVSGSNFGVTGVRKA